MEQRVPLAPPVTSKPEVRCGGLPTTEIMVDGHKVLKVVTSSAVGYAPVDLLAAGRIEEAARVAEKAARRDGVGGGGGYGRRYY